MFYCHECDAEYTEEELEVLVDDDDNEYVACPECGNRDLEGESDD